MHAPHARQAVFRFALPDFRQVDCRIIAHGDLQHLALAIDIDSYLTLQLCRHRQHQLRYLTGNQLTSRHSQLIQPLQAFQHAFLDIFQLTMYHHTASNQR